MSEPLTDGYLELVRGIGYARPTRASGGYWLPTTEAEIDLTRQAEALDAARTSLLAEVDRLRAESRELDDLRRLVLPQLRREIEHHKDGKARWRARAEAAEALTAIQPAHVLREAADTVVASCPDHQPADAEGSWISCHCPVADELRRTADTSEKAITAGLAGLFTRLGPPDVEEGAATS